MMGARMPDGRSDPGRFVVVTRHPREGREIAAFGGRPLFRGRDVLDVGTGQGRLALEIARMARRVVGVDPFPAPIREARRRARELGLDNVTFQVRSAVDVGRMRERFDLAILSWSL